MQIGSTSLIHGADAAPKKPSALQDKQSDKREQSDALASGRVSVVRSPSQPSDVDEARQYQRFTRDTDNASNKQAVALYLQLEKMEQREHIQTLFGVDTFA